MFQLFLDKREKLYRYDYFLEGFSEDYYVEPNVRLKCRGYPIIKKTKCGVWIEQYCRKGKKFVNLMKRKKFACETPQEALEQFLHRKQRQQSILEEQLKHIKISISLAKNELNINERNKRI